MLVKHGFENLPIQNVLKVRCLPKEKRNGIRKAEQNVQHTLDLLISLTT